MSRIIANNIRHNDATADSLSFDSSARVGIGTSSPAVTVHAEAAQAELQLKSTSGTNSAGLRFVPGGETNALYIYADGSRNINIDNHATSIASFRAGGGLTFNGDTAAANALDDYEEGTWTPSYTTGFTGTYQTNGQIGRYIKVGNLVTAYFFIQVNSISGSGALALGGLPFATVSATNYNPGAVIQLTGNWNTTHPFCVDANGSGTSTYNVKYRSSSSGNTDSNSTVAHLATNAYMRATIVYETA